MNLKLIVLTAVLSASFGVYAQDLKKPPQVILPSPEAASLGKFGNWPVNMHTGVPNIDVPLYTIDLRGFQLPIRINYHASGIKVEDVPSWVGSGWTLEAGGVITRTVRGIEDEFSNGYWQNRADLGNIPTVLDPTNEQHYRLMANIAGGFYDTEPDLFHFNFAGIAGKLFFDNQGIIRTIPHSDIKIIQHPLLAGPAGTGKWEIVDNKGNTYILGANYNRETTSTEQDMLFKQQLTAWYLTQIILANKIDTIHFDYLSKSEAYMQKGVQTYRAPVTIFPPTPIGGLGSMPYGVLIPNAHDINRASGLSKLRRIRWKYGTIDFHSATNRKDILVGTLLDSIVISNSYQRLKEYTFHYDNNTTRLRLDSVVERGMTSSDRKGSYGFTYNSGLPDRLSNSQDYWGYFNGQPNYHLIAYDQRLAATRVDLFPAIWSDRKVHASYMPSGTLNRIAYPTGGHTDFVFEPNDYYTVGDQTTIPGEYQQANAGSTVRVDNPSMRTYETTFTGPVRSDAEINVSIRNYYKPPDANDSWLPRATLYGINGTTSTQLYKVDAFHDWGNAIYRQVNGPTEDLDFKFNSATLLTGYTSYKLVLEIACPYNNCQPFPLVTTLTGSITYYKWIDPRQVPGVSQNVLAGGLRVKEIASYPGANNPPLIKKYDYTRDTTIDGQIVKISSGVLITKPDFFSATYQRLFCDSWTEGVDPGSIKCNQLYTQIGVISAVPGTALLESQGGYVGYAQVKEVQEGINETITTTQQYSTALNQHHNGGIPGIVGSLGYRAVYPVTDRNYARGLQLKKIVEQKKGNQVKTLLTEIYTYALNDAPGMPKYYGDSYLRVKRVADSIGQNGCCGPIDPRYVAEMRPNEFAYDRYQELSPWVRPTGKTVIQDGVTLQESYTYSINGHTNIVSTKTLTSKQEENIAEVKFPQDMVAAGLDPEGVYAKMTARNMLAVPVETRSLNGTADLERVQSIYKDWTSNTNLLLPEKIITSRSGATFTSIQFHEYDTYGNIRAMTGQNGITNSYSWTADKQYPAASILNATPNQYFVQDFEDVSGPGVVSGAAHTGRKFFTGTSYTISFIRPDAKKYYLRYWKFVSGKWVYHQQEYTSNNMVLTAGAPIDDIAVFPERSLLTSYTYFPLLGISSEIKPIGTTYYVEYDNFGRMRSAKDQNGNLIKLIDYSYQISVP